MGRFYNYLVAVASAMGGFLFGYEIGIIDQVLHMDSFGLEFGLKSRIYDANATNGSYVTTKTAENADITGWITSSFLLGCVGGAAVSGYLTDAIGRRFTILAGCLLFIIGGSMQTGAPSVGVLYGGRVISGSGVGFMSAAVPMYIAETAPTETRGRLVSTYQLMITFGILIASAVNAAILSTLTGELEWRLAMGIQIIPAIILLLLIIILPFSPRWLVTKKRDQEALAILARLRGGTEKSESVQTEFAGIKQEQEEEEAAGSVSWRELAQKGVRMRVFVGATLQLFQQWTGINIILYYAASLFADMGFQQTNSSVTFVIINAAINFVATFPGMWLVERIGRTKLMIIGGIVMGLSHCLVCLFIGLSPRLPSLSWGAVIFIYVFTIAFAASWGPVVWVYQSEIFPMNCRAKGIAICTVSNWAWNAVIAKITPIFFVEITFYTYLIFGGMCFAMALFVIFFVPETEGKSLEEMDEVFGRVQQKPKTAASSSIAYLTGSDNVSIRKRHSYSLASDGRTDSRS